MQRFSFDDAGIPIDRFGSRAANVKHLSRAPHLVMLRLGPGGLIGGHPAGGDQLFLVVQGDGWVRVEDGEPEPIAAGEAALWGAGEWHESGSDGGMTAIVLEAEALEVALEAN